MNDILACLSLCILRFVSLDASFEMLCCMHPSRCFVVCILRGAFLYASFEVLCCMHPSRCFVVCGKNVYNFVIVITRREKTSTILLLLLPDELSARVMFRKMSSPFLALGSLGP